MAQVGSRHFYQYTSAELRKYLIDSYSLLEVFDKILGWKFTNVEYATGLPEYRSAEFDNNVSISGALTSVS